MRILSIIIPGSGDISSDIIAKAVLELSAAATNGDIKVNLWDPELNVTAEYTTEDTPTINKGVARAAAEISKYNAEDYVTCVAHLAANIINDESGRLRNSVKVIALHPNTKQLHLFGLKDYQIKACKKLLESFTNI